MKNLEEKVFEICKAEANRNGDTGVEFCFEDVEEITAKELGLSENETKGYIGSLVKKGDISVMRGCYFDFAINNK